MVELQALTRAREIRQACRASSRRAGWEFRRACGEAAYLARWVDEGESVVRLGSQWAGLGWAGVSLLAPGAGGKKGLSGWFQRGLALAKIVQKVHQVWSNRR